MIRALPLLKAAAGAVLLAAVAPSTAGPKAATPATTPAAAHTGAYTVAIAPGGQGAKDVVERLPHSQIAWEFDHEPDGTDAIKGPNGTIWRGNLQVTDGPHIPQSAPQFPSGYSITLRDPKTGQLRHYQVLPPGRQSTPSMPNFTPILPPGQIPPRIIPPKLKP